MIATANPLERLTREELLHTFDYYYATNRQLYSHAQTLLTTLLSTGIEDDDDAAERTERLEELGLLLSYDAAPDDLPKEMDRLLRWVEEEVGLKGRLDNELYELGKRRKWQCN